MTRANGIGNAYGHESSFFTIGNTYNGVTVTAGMAIKKAIMHGIVRGMVQAGQGGKFESGFASGFVSSGFSVGNRGYGGIYGRTAIMAVVGGTTSVITGGKFANGAESGAFVHLFNSEGVVSKFFAKQGAQQAGGKGAEEIAKSLNTNKAVENISKDAGAGVVGGAIGGTIVFGFPIGTIGGAIFGLAGGLVTGAAKESFGVNQYVDDTATKVDDYIFNCSCGEPRGHK